jgi:UDP-N-acetylmuramyl tripeptide synthase
MMVILQIITLRLLSLILRLLHLGHGTTWPGHIALIINPHFIRETLATKRDLKVIVIAGTNGKTTTSAMLKSILQANGSTVIHNESGANLLNGIASALINNLSTLQIIMAKSMFAVFEVDENTLPLLLNELEPTYLVLLNLFRDQLDRYGEVHTIADKWKRSIAKLRKTVIIANADDPEIVNIQSSSIKSLYFGLSKKNDYVSLPEHASDALFCPRCKQKLSYEYFTFSHLGKWKCLHCDLKRPNPDLSSLPFYPLSGQYNQYNNLAAVLTARVIGIKQEIIEKALINFKPVFGRQEKFAVKNKFVQILLSKNPTSFNQSLSTVMLQKPKAILFVLNDQIPDGKDISWIWDTDIEKYSFDNINITISGDRAYDMALRIKYALSDQGLKMKNKNDFKRCKIYQNLTEAIHQSLENINNNETLYILPTYSAMLKAREILTGKRIL